MIQIEPFVIAVGARSFVSELNGHKLLNRGRYGGGGAGIHPDSFSSLRFSGCWLGPPISVAAETNRCGFDSEIS
jgi:hypothetical protein